jgi:hypothetical protein
VAAITIHEGDDSAGHLVRTCLSHEAGQLSLVVGGETFPLPAGALEAVMKRYGKPLAEDLAANLVAERLDVGEGRTLVRFRFMPRYDVIGRDYLALYEPNAEPLCELATSVTAALDFLARRATAED